MKTAMEQLIEYAEKILEHSNINAHLIIVKAKELQEREAKVKTLVQPDVVKSLPDNKMAIYGEYDYIIASMQHGTSYIGKSEETIKHHNNIIDWLKKRRDGFKGNVL